MSERLAKYVGLQRALPKSGRDLAIEKHLGIDREPVAFLCGYYHGMLDELIEVIGEDNVISIIHKRQLVQDVQSALDAEIARLRDQQEPGGEP